MSRVLLADSSPHAQRMGGEILREEGFKVESAADGIEAAAKLRSFDPLVIVADVQLPLKSGYDLSKEAKAAIDGVAVLLTVGARAVAPTADQLRESRCDATIGKPFEATALIGMVRRLAAEAEAVRASRRKPKASAGLGEVDRERIEAAVTLAVEASLPALIQEITERVLIALKR
jgi:DNA-binding response OmpR family regulator